MSQALRRIPREREMKVTLVVACALIDADNRVLIARRPDGKTMAGLWERRSPSCAGLDSQMEEAASTLF